MIPAVIFYILAVIPFVYGGIMWALGKRVHWIEWIGNAALCFALAGVFHFVGLYGQTIDTETWSGRVEQAVFHPRWVEQYQQMHTRTVSDGRGGTRTEIYYTTEYRTHHEYWVAETTISNIRISEDKYHELAQKFGNHIETRWVHKSGFHKGDHNIYIAHNKTGWLEPVTDTRYFENRVKAAPSVFSFEKVPIDIKVFPYPVNADPFRSDRLVGTAANTVDYLTFDQFNAVLGPLCKVNVILVGMGDVDSMMAEWQRAAWIGGKKNDVVIVWGGDNKKPNWVKCFGWTDEETCKRNLEQIVLENGISNDVLPLIGKEIRANYKLKNWNDFSHISVPVPMWALWSFIIFMLVSQVALWIFFHKNEYDKDGNGHRYPSYYTNHRYFKFR